ncbi:hypothetical protein bcCo53_001570 (plasmid) [Borrelia coriaceae]|uniref:adenine deaminase C-terminal domain-containing protein n=1 Tax=Borrelia coriaceae TaxID=144 RepID=UPI0012DF8FBA|nr:hypothetical protein bcCo53_001570 [Borrelia coriaceae]
MLVGFIKNCEIENGTIERTVTHNFHNIVILSMSNEYLYRIANLIIKNKRSL